MVLFLEALRSPRLKGRQGSEGISSYRCAARRSAIFDKAARLALIHINCPGGSQSGGALRALTT
jgi:hypothetical protein